MSPYINTALNKLLIKNINDNTEILQENTTNV